MAQEERGMAQEERGMAQDERGMAQDAEGIAALVARTLRHPDLPGLFGLNGSRVDALVEAMARVEEDPELLGLDCEMVLTSGDSKALARVSVVGSNGEVLLDRLVCPPAEVIDWRTQITGLDPDVVRETGMTADQAREACSALFRRTPGCIVVGHELRYDLGALGFDLAFFVESFPIIDTSLLFPPIHRGKQVTRCLSLCFLAGLLAVTDGDSREEGEPAAAAAVADDDAIFLRRDSQPHDSCLDATWSVGIVRKLLANPDLLDATLRPPLRTRSLRVSRIPLGARTNHIAALFPRGSPVFIQEPCFSWHHTPSQGAEVVSSRASLDGPGPTAPTRSPREAAPSQSPELSSSLTTALDAGLPAAGDTSSPRIQGCCRVYFASSTERDHAIDHALRTCGRGKRLHVRNLDAKVTEDQVRTVFRQFGQLTDVRCIRPPNRGGRRGSCYAFVTFRKVDDAAEACTSLSGGRVFVPSGHHHGAQQGRHCGQERRRNQKHGARKSSTQEKGAELADPSAWRVSFARTAGFLCALRDHRGDFVLVERERDKGAG